MSLYIYQRAGWPFFEWDESLLSPLLGKVRYLQGKIAGRMEGVGISVRTETTLTNLTDDILKSTEIEGEVLNPLQVRSSIARRLGIEIAGLVPSDRNVDGVVEMMLDATQKYTDKLTKERLWGWQSSLFPSGWSGMYQVVTGNWRDNTKGPMQVVSGPLGRERIHYQAPSAELIDDEMSLFFRWFNNDTDTLDPVIKAGIAHLWFVTIHPFDDGNGRIARALTDMQLARAEQNTQRYYSMSTQIRLERKSYYDILEKTQKSSLDITQWLEWFLSCLYTALQTSDEMLSTILQKALFWEKHKETLLNERQRLMIIKLQDGIEGKLSSSKWAKMAKCSQDTAGRDIQDLIEKGILQKEDAGGRSTSYYLVV
jgi:Fic family protein